ELDQTSLPACHALFQFFVAEGRLSVMMYQRSCDLFLGVPFNMAEYALLLHLVAQFTGLVPHEFIHVLADAHVYRDHFDAARQQLEPAPYPSPRLALDPSLRTLDDVVARYHAIGDRARAGGRRDRAHRLRWRRDLRAVHVRGRPHLPPPGERRRCRRHVLRLRSDRVARARQRRASRGRPSSLFVQLRDARARPHVAMSPATRTGAAFVWDPKIASHVYREDHPLKPRRLIGVYDSLSDLGAFDRAGVKLLAPRSATREEIERIHAPEYVEAVMRASVDPRLNYSEFGLAPYGDTPPFSGMHEVSLLTTGGSLVAM